MQNIESYDEVFKDTIMSMNEKEKPCYLIEESSNENQHYIDKNNQRDNSNLHQNNYYNNSDFNNNINEKLTSDDLNNNSQKNLFLKDLISSSKDSENNYMKSNEKLLYFLKNSVDYLSNGDNLFFPQGTNSKYRDNTIKLLTEELEKNKSDKELLIQENKKLKEKIKFLLKNSNNISNNNMNNSHLSKSNQNISSISYLDDCNVPVNKLVESFMKLQFKYDEIEKENNYLKTENEELNRKLCSTKEKDSSLLLNNQNVNLNMSSKYSPFNKSRAIVATKNSESFSNSLLRKSSTNKDNSEMECLIKEQLKCMTKMLQLVQEGNQINEVKYLFNYLF